MAEDITELEKRKVLRMSNEESNRLTRECLQTALVYLMSEKCFDKITVTELVKRSGVSRTAFYRNYSSKEEILAEMSNDFLKQLTASLSTPRYMEHPYEWYYDFFQEINKHAELFGLLLQAHLPMDTLFGPDGILELVHPSSSIRERYHNLALEGAFTKILVYWFKSGRKESSEEMAAMCAEIL
ncbi:MAG: TetR/AcrR family transcriptional regulator [Eubacteriales bacterium]|nr:TetR/AcrR family transcriptional regulator [Eubacteriales bacterium]